jgi:hypothetical protein
VYHLFGSTEYESAGGMADMLGAHETIEQAEAAWAEVLAKNNVTRDYQFKHHAWAHIAEASVGLLRKISEWHWQPWAWTDLPILDVIPQSEGVWTCCQACGRSFKLLHDEHGNKGAMTLLVFTCESGGVYGIEAVCPACDHRETIL